MKKLVKPAVFRNFSWQHRSNLWPHDPIPNIQAPSRPSRLRLDITRKKTYENLSNLLFWAHFHGNVAA